MRFAVDHVRLDVVKRHADVQLLVAEHDVPGDVECVDWRRIAHVGSFIWRMMIRI
jgi:hypothetical protein